MIDKRKFYINGSWEEPVIKNDFEVNLKNTIKWYLDHSQWCKEISKKSNFFGHYYYRKKMSIAEYRHQRSNHLQ